MEQLKEVWKYRFWICLGLAGVLTLTGWWLDVSRMSQASEERIKKLDSSFTSLPNPNGHPNPKWSNPLKTMNEDETKKVDSTRKLLWDHQVQLMSWPPVIAKAVSTIPYLTTDNKRGTIGDKERTLYRTSYQVEVDKVHSVIQPLNQDSGEGLVLFPKERMLVANYDTYTPTSDEVWESQEDLWLYQAVLEAIASVNQAAAPRNRFEAPIQEIRVLYFRGGDPEYKPTGGTASTDATGGAMQMGMMSRPADGDEGSLQSGASSSSFDPSEEWGPDGGSTGGATSKGMGVMDSRAMGGPAQPAGQTETASTAKKRFIAENDKYKTRGFYLEVVMDHRKVPDLQVAILNSPWFMKIVRLHQTDLQGGSSGSGANGSRGVAGSQMMRGMAGIAGMAGGAPPTTMIPPASSRPGGANTGVANSGSMPRSGMMGSSGGAMDLNNPFLAQVSLAGLITIYLPPPPDPAATTTPPGQTTPTTPGTETPKPETTVGETSTTDSNTKKPEEGKTNEDLPVGPAPDPKNEDLPKSEDLPMSEELPKTEDLPNSEDLSAPGEAEEKTGNGEEKPSTENPSSENPSSTVEKEAP